MNQVKVWVTGLRHGFGEDTDQLTRLPRVVADPYLHPEIELDGNQCHLNLGPVHGRGARRLLPILFAKNHQ